MNGEPSAVAEPARSYPLTLGSRLVSVLLGVVLLAVGAGLAVVFFRSAVHAYAALLALILPLLGLYLLLYAWRWRLTLSAAGIERRGVFGVRRLAFADICGRRSLQTRSGTDTVLGAADGHTRALRFSAGSVQTDG